MKEKAKKQQNHSKLLITLLILIGSALCYQEFNLDSSRALRAKVAFKRYKTLRIKLSRSILTSMENNDYSFYYQLVSDQPIKSTVSGVPTRPNTKKGITTYQSANAPSVTQFSSGDEEVFDDVKEKGIIYLRFDRGIDGGPEDNKQATVTVKFAVARVISLQENKELMINCKGSKENFIRVPFDPMQNRRGLMKISLYEYESDSEIKVFGRISKKPAGPLPTESRNDFVLTQFSKHEYAQVLDNGNAQDCYKSRCYITLKIKLTGKQDRYYFGTKVVLSGLEQIGETYPVPDRMLHGGIRYYKFSANYEAGFEITMTPIEGDGSFYVSPGLYLSDPTKSMFGLTVKAKKRIIISQEQLKNIGIRGKTELYIAVKSDDRISYMLAVRQMTGNSVGIKPGMVEAGEMIGNETKSHILDLSDFNQPISHVLNVRLHLISGDADILMKGRAPGKGFELSGAELQTTKDIGTLKISKEKKGIKTVTYPVYCIRQINEASPKNLIRSGTCQFGIFIRSKNKDGKGKVHYELSVEDNVGSHQLVKNHFLRIKLLEKETKWYHYVYTSELRRNQKEIKFELDVRYGNVEICVKRSESKPKDFNNCLSKQVINGDNHGLSTNLRTIKIGNNDGAKTGRYYIGVTGKSYAAVNIGAMEKKIGSNEDPGTMITKRLKAGVAISERLTGNSNIRYYSFQLTLPKSVEAIAVNLLPKRGKYKMAITNDGSKPNFNSNHWVSFNNEVLIDKEDPMFDSKAVYIIAVAPTVEGDEELAKNKERTFQYQIKYSYTDKHSILTPGVPETGTLQGNSQCFVIEAKPDFEDLLILKSLRTRTMYMFVNIGGNNYKPSIESYDYMAERTEVGLDLTKKQIQEKCKFSRSKPICHVYVCLKGIEREKYTIVYTYNEKPIMAHKEDMIYMPLPQREKTIHFIYHANPEKPFYVEETIKGVAIKMFASCINEEETKNGLRFPTATDHQFAADPASTYVNVIQVAPGVLSKYKNPICLVTVQTGPKFYCSSYYERREINSIKTDADSGTYCMDKWTSIQFFEEDKELQQSTPSELFVYQYQFSYFFFYNPKPDDDIEIEIKTIDNSAAMVYVDRGKDKRPNVRLRLSATYALNSHTSRIILKKDQLKARGYKDLRGYYVVAVYTYSKPGARVLLQWRHGTEHEIYGVLGYPFRMNTWKGQNAYAHVNIFSPGLYGYQLIVKGGSVESNFTLYLQESYVKTEANTLDLSILYPKKETCETKLDLNFRNKTVHKYLPALKKRWGKLMITMESHSKFSDAELLLYINNRPTYLSYGQSTIGWEHRYKKSPHPYQVYVRPGVFMDLTISKKAMIQISDSETWINDVQKNGAKIVKQGVFKDQLYPGYNFVDLYNLNMKGSKKVLIHCQEECDFEITMIDPKRVTFVKLNTVKKGLLHKKFPTLRYKIYNKVEQKLTVRARIVRVFKWNQNRTKGFVFSQPELTRAQAKDFVKVFNSRSVVRNYLNYLHSLKAQILRTKKHWAFPHLVKNRVQMDHLETQIGHDSVYITFDAKPGLYEIELNGLKDKFVQYELEVTNLRGSSAITPGMYKVEEISNLVTEKSTNKKHYRYYLSKPGVIELSFVPCFGDFRLSMNGQEGVEISDQRKENGAANFFYEITKKGYVDFYVEANEQKFGITEDVKNLAFEKSFYGIQISDLSSKHLFAGLDGGKVSLTFSGHQPYIKFRPLRFPENQKPEDYKYVIHYTVVIADSEWMVNYYFGCNKVGFGEILNSKYKGRSDELIQVKRFKDNYYFDSSDNWNFDFVRGATDDIENEQNQRNDKDQNTNKNDRNRHADNGEKNKRRLLTVSGGLNGKDFVISADVHPGRVYYASIFADVIATLKESGSNDNPIDEGATVFKRIHYHTIKFETSTIMLPIEMITAILGLIAISVVSCLMIKKQVFRIIAKIPGFTAVGSAVNDELEEYFLKLQSEEKEFEESQLGDGEEYATEEVSSRRGGKKKEEEPQQPAELLREGTVETTKKIHKPPEAASEEQKAEVEGEGKQKPEPEGDKKDEDKEDIEKEIEKVIELAEIKAPENEEEDGEEEKED